MSSIVIAFLVKCMGVMNPLLMSTTQSEKGTFTALQQVVLSALAKVSMYNYMQFT